jgi:septal ring factor EnvC (AmiA/AmiB activator)
MIMALNMNATPETVWALLQENALAMKELRESQQETDKKFQETAAQMKESKAEHDRIIAETAAQIRETEKELKETGRLVKELSKNVGGLNGSLGDMAEGLMATDLYEHFEAQGLDFDSSVQNYVLKEKKTKVKLAEVDMLLVNGTIAMAV